MMRKITVEDVEFNAKRVLMRVDFNVPLKDGEVANDQRIRAALPTIRHISERGGRLVLMSHLGRPKGSRLAEMSLKPCVPVLGDLLGKKVQFVDDCIGPPAQAAVGQLNDGDILIMENLRFHKEETENDDGFSAELARLGDIYVNDAFGTAHRAHASTVGVTRHIQPCAAGFLMTKELRFLGGVLENPEKPFVAVLGGAKISGKIDVISNLLPKVDRIIIGGGMAFTFFKARGLHIGNSLLEEEKIDVARSILDQGSDKLILPVDVKVSDRFDFDARKIGSLSEVDAEKIPDGAVGLDIGTRTVARYRDLLLDARTVVWNGPMGVFEIEDTAKGTYAIADVLAEATAKGATTVIGGGDSAAAVNKAGVADKVSHVSTGGGASLEFMEGRELPGVAALNDR